ncbi:MAG: hypothetical protein IPP46_06390 [Bacteroidetes bacterium]|nr:hypothetical protein [Bacteroidota bacterium]
MSEEWTNDVQEVSLTDMTGKQVYSSVPENSEQAAHPEVPVNQFPQGPVCAQRTFIDDGAPSTIEVVIDKNRVRNSRRARLTHYPFL